MKRIALILCIILVNYGFALCPLQEKNVLQVPRLSPKEHLEGLQAGDWIFASVRESYENELIEQIIGQEKLEGCRALSLEEYRTLVSERGLSIAHSEVHRGFFYFQGAEALWEWVEKELAPELGLAPFDAAVLADEFLARMQPVFGKGIYLPYKRLLMRVDTL